jgi:hypothetical protein
MDVLKRLWTVTGAPVIEIVCSALERVVAILRVQHRSHTHPHSEPLEAASAEGASYLWVASLKVGTACQKINTYIKC